MTTVHAADRAQWRAWLHDNAGTADEVWLVIHHKGSATASVQHREALCFGWIDSLARKHDAESWCQRFTPRSPRGAWSKVNRELVEQLTAQGLMTPAGQAAVDLAKRTGTWSALADAQNGVVPDDLREQLAADETAAAHFAAFSPSARRALLEWIARAKRPETRQRRIARTVDAAARNERP
ncbi:YdeI/OmpD-associated family protein [Pseudonocardia nigra]|uniref:YdeI/OmpD-associated family protein n=1 Tax=Pseudonocardia nigra TaxID=1921578 RepID=UPI001C5E16FD|nr:YdeI/OmpD-associated family protein [Pseudonocardia nigra]